MYLHTKFPTGETFSSPDLKAQVSFSNWTLFADRLHCHVVNFSHFHLLCWNHFAFIHLDHGVLIYINYFCFFAGRRFAEQELYVLLSKMLKNFTLEYSGDLDMKFQVLMVPDRPTTFTFKNRNSSWQRSQTVHMHN